MNKKPNLQRMVVFPALSSPKIKILTSLDPNKDWNIFVNKIPIVLYDALSTNSVTHDLNPRERDKIQDSQKIGFPCNLLL